MTKSFFVAAALTLLAVPAFAQEGNGSPFPNRVPGVSTAVRTAQYASLGMGQEVYPDVRGRPGANLFVSLEPVVGLANEAPVQTANSEPVGFTNGTAAYASIPARMLLAGTSRLAAR